MLSFRRLVSVLAPAFCLVAFGGNFAAETARESTALEFIPADASLYGSFLKLGEQFEALMDTEEYQALADQDWFPESIVEGIGMLLDNSPDDSGESWREFWKTPENEELETLIHNLLSEEIVLYCDGSLPPALLALDAFNSDMNRLQAEMLERIGQGNPGAEENALAELMIKHATKFDVPRVLLAFKCSDEAAAQSQLKRLETLLKQLLANFPTLAPKLTRKEIKDAEFLIFEADGGLIPKEAFDGMNAAPETKAQLIAVLKKKKAAVAMGVWNGYFILSVGDSTASIQKLGTGKLLADAPEFTRLHAAGDKPFTTIQFGSADLLRAAAGNSNAFESSMQTIPAMLRLFGTDAEMIKDLENDVKKLAAEMETPPEAIGANLFFSYLTDFGYEVFDYNWGKNDGADASKPLSILDHVGGSPLLFVAGRQRVTGAWYDRLSHWLERFRFHTERITLDKLQLNDDQKEEYAKIRAEIEQMLARFDEITRTNLLPALKDGQHAVVLDAKHAEKKWGPNQPEAQRPLPAPQLAFAVGINQAGLFRQAGEDYLRLAQEVINRLSEIQPGFVPKVKVPAPESRDFPEGTVYFYRIDQALGTSPKIAPNVGLSDNFAVFSLFPLQSKLMLGEAPLKEPGLLQSKRPRSFALQIRIAALVDAIEPWIEYGFDQQLTEFEAAAAANPDADAGDDSAVTFDDVLPVLNLIRRFKSITTESYLEKGVQVTHGEWRFGNK